MEHMKDVVLGAVDERLKKFKEKVLENQESGNKGSSNPNRMENDVESEGQDEGRSTLVWREKQQEESFIPHF